MATTTKQSATKKATKKTTTKQTTTKQTSMKQRSAVRKRKATPSKARTTSATRVSAYVRPGEATVSTATRAGEDTRSKRVKSSVKNSRKDNMKDSSTETTSSDTSSMDAMTTETLATSALVNKPVEMGLQEEHTVDGILSGEGVTVDEVVAEVMTPQRKRRERRSELAALEWKRYQRTGSPETRRRLLGLYLPLVRSVAGRMAMGFPRSVDIQDLINTGVLGLSEAFKKFDPDRGVKFETYAVPRIRGAILDELRALDWVPRSTRAKARNIDRATVSLENDHGRPPTEDELAERLECTPQELMTAVGDVSSATILSLDEVIYRDEENRQVPRIESVEDTAETSVLKQVLKEEMRTFLRVAINNLTEQEKLVIALYYFEELTLKEIGAVMTISESRVSQIHTKGVGKLRGLIQERYDGSVD
jgi:RNA polymerase sigma factor FliA